MSQKNVEVVQAAVAAWHTEDLGASRDLYDPDVVLRMAEGWPEPGPFLGRDAVIRQFRQMRDTLEGGIVEPVSDFIDIADRVVVRLVWRGEGRGPQMDMEGTTINTVRHGKLCGIEFFWDHSDALEAVGLSE